MLLKPYVLKFIFIHESPVRISGDIREFCVLVHSTGEIVFGEFSAFLCAFLVFFEACDVFCHELVALA
jgi:hypothetical protein